VRCNATLLEGSLCLISLFLLPFDLVLFIDFEVGVIANLGEPPGPCLAMLDKQMGDEPIFGVELEAWVEIFHLLIVSKWRGTDMIGLTFATMRSYSAL
jgi:hypothetical protein